MSCKKLITKGLTSDCSTQGNAGIEQVIYLINRSQIAEITYDSTIDTKVTDIDLESGAKAYKLIGQKQNLNAFSERVINDTVSDMYRHGISFNSFSMSAEDIENIDEMQDFVAIVERKNKKNIDGTFLIYGLGSGLFISSDTYNSNENYGARMLEATSLDSQLESNSAYVLVKTDYATTKAFLEGLV